MILFTTLWPDGPRFKFNFAKRRVWFWCELRDEWVPDCWEGCYRTLMTKRKRRV